MEQYLTKSLITPASWSTDVGFINHLILFNNIYVGVLAEKSGGKSAFCSILKKNVADAIDTIEYVAQPGQDNLQGILAAIAKYLNKPLEQDDSIASLLVQINEKQRHLLL